MAEITTIDDFLMNLKSHSKTLHKIKKAFHENPSWKEELKVMFPTNELLNKFVTGKTDAVIEEVAELVQFLSNKTDIPVGSIVNDGMALCVKALTFEMETVQTAEEVSEEMLPMLYQVLHELPGAVKTFFAPLSEMASDTTLPKLRSELAMATEFLLGKNITKKQAHTLVYAFAIDILKKVPDLVKS